MVDVFDRHGVRFDLRLAGCSKFVRYSDFAELAAENRHLENDLSDNREYVSQLEAALAEQAAENERLKQRLAPHPRDTSTVVSHETANVSDKPEAQQYPFGYVYEHDGMVYDWNSPPVLTKDRQPERMRREPWTETPLYTRPSEQAVTEKMVDAAWNDWQTGKQEYGPEAIRSALKAAMEAVT